MIGVPAGDGGRGPRGAAAAAGHDGDDRPHARRHRDRRRARRARRDEARRLRAQLRDRPARDDRAPSPPLSPLRPADLRACPNAGLPCVVHGHMHYDLTPDQLAELPHPLRHRARRAGHRRMLRHHARAPRAVVERCRDLTPAARHPDSSRRCRRCTARTIAPGHVVPRSSASAPTPTGRRRSATRCSPPTGTPACAWPRDQIREGAHVLDVCVDYVGRDGAVDMDDLAAALRHAGERAAGARLHRAGGDGGRPAVHIGGRAVLNSANLEDGEGPRARASTA